MFGARTIVAHAPNTTISGQGPGLKAHRNPAGNLTGTGCSTVCNRLSRPSCRARVWSLPRTLHAQKGAQVQVPQRGVRKNRITRQQTHDVDTLRALSSRWRLEIQLPGSSLLRGGDAYARSRRCARRAPRRRAAPRASAERSASRTPANEYIERRGRPNFGPVSSFKNWNT
eukprot:4468145-Prymnesium_polylepis.2